VSDTELVQAEFLPHGLADSMTDAKEDSMPLVNDAAVPKAPVPDSSTNQSLHNVPDLDTAAPLEGAPAATQPAPASPVSDVEVVNSDPAVAIKVELLHLQHAQEDNRSGSDASAPADADRSVQQVGKPDAAASLDVTAPEVDTVAVADLLAQLIPTSAAEDCACSSLLNSHTASTDANETTEATGRDEPATILQGNTEGTGGVVPITIPAVEVQQAAQQQLLLGHLASAGTPNTMPDMPSYVGSKRQDARSLSAQSNQLSGSVVSANTSAADSLVDAALRETPSMATPSQKEIAERPISGELSSSGLEVSMGPEATIAGRVTDPKSFPALLGSSAVTSPLPPSAATPSLGGSALVPGIADAGTEEPTESDEEGLHAMRGR